MSLDDEIHREGELNRAKQLRARGQRDTSKLSYRQTLELEVLTEEQCSRIGYRTRRERKKAHKAAFRQRKGKKSRNNKPSDQANGR
jgi:hypothetical protein